MPLIKLEFNNIIQKPILVIQQRGNKLHLGLNLKEDLLRLHKEKYSLFRVIQHFKLQMNITPLAGYKSDEFHKYQPVAISLQQLLRTFQVTISKVDDEFDMLIAKKKHAAQVQLLNGLQKTWRIEQHVKRYAHKVLVRVIEFETEVNNVMQKTSFINSLLEEMKECELEKSQFQDRLSQIKRQIDELDLEEASNLNFWVNKLNAKIEDILIKRLEQLLKAWIDEFCEFEEKGGNLIKKSLIMDVKLQNRTIMLEPSLSEARAFWYKELHNQVEVICGLERLSIRTAESQETTYKGLLLKMSENFNIKQAYGMLEEIFKNAEAYVDTWKSYQALWDIDQSKVYELLGDDIEQWNQLLNEIRQGRKTFDTAEDFKLFGGLEISYGTVQAKVNNKYD